MIRIPIISEYKDKGFKDAEKGVKGMEASFKRLGKQIGVTFAAAQIIDFGREAIGAASDLEESANAVRVTFGESADAIERLGENAADAVGLSQSAFNEAAVGLSAFASQVTPAGEEIASTIEDMTTRAADFASVHNLSVQDAISVFQSTLAGSAEVARQYGVDVSAATVEQHLLAEGIADSKSEITEADKVLGRYNLLMRETEETAGDFTNTSDSLANSTKILEADFENLKAKAGEELLPVMQDLVGAAIGLVEAAEKLGVIELVAIGAEALNVKEWAGGIGRSIRGAFDSGARANYEFARSVDFADETYKDFDYTLLGTASSFAEVQDVVYDLVDADSDLINTQHLVNQVFLEQKRRIDEARESQTKAYYANRFGADGFDDLTEAVEDSSDELVEYRSVWDREIARINTEQDVLDIAEQFDELREKAADAFNSAAEGAEDAEEKLLDFEEGLRDAYRDALDLARELDGLPETVITEIRQEYETGDLAALETRLKNLTLGVIAPVRVLITAETRGISGYLGMSAEKAAEQAMVDAILAGAPSTTTPGLTGSSNTRYGAPMAGNAVPTNITINMPPGSDGEEVVEATRNWMRTNGAAPFVTTDRVSP